MQSRYPSGILMEMHAGRCQGCLPGRRLNRAGITLLELLIVLTIIVVMVFIALPTLKPTDQEQKIAFAKEHLAYLYEQEQAYFNIHGTYASMSALATDEQLGPDYDQRFAFDESVVEGIVFRGPTTETRIFDIVAVITDTIKYKVDQTGSVTPLQ